MHRTERHPDLPPPISQTGFFGWIKENLFSSWINSLLTVLGLYVLYATVPPFIRWSIIDANWAGLTRESCEETLGACWVFIRVRIGLLFYGFYPDPERWRIDLAALLFVGNAAPLLAAPFLPLPPRLRRLVLCLMPAACAAHALWHFSLPAGLLAVAFLGAPFVLPRVAGHVQKHLLRLPGGLVLWSCASGLAVGGLAALLRSGAEWPLGLMAGLAVLLTGNLGKATVARWQFWCLYLLFPCIAYILLLGGAMGLPAVATDQWGGMFLTLVIALVGVATSLPLGVLLALGRTSTMPLIRALCISFIEFARGVPLISVLFMVSVMLPMMLPQGAHFNKLLRALLGVSLFYAAYMAEVVRGGLQGIPKGQYEAASALGLRYSTHMRLIILPQALRLVIPGITNTFLGLMKDTTLVAVINLMDILGIIKSSLADTQWLGFTKEAYFFAGIIFWLLCFIVSRYSLYLEKRLSWK